jgi:hypothetical protein
MEIINKPEGERLDKLRELIKSKGKVPLREYPYFEIIAKVYLHELIDMGDGSKKGTTWFRNSGAKVLVGEKNVGYISSALGIGHMILKYEGENIEYVIAADEVWEQVGKVIGFDLETVAGKETNVDVDQPKQMIPDNEQDTSVANVDEVHDEPIKSVPDYRRSGITHGGWLKDVPDPHIYYWPGAEDKRKLYARIMRYYGIGPHYHVSISQEDNPVWDCTIDKYRKDEPRGWVTTWDNDFPGKGKTYLNDEAIMRTYRSYHLAKQALIDIHQKYFTDHELVWEDYTDEEHEQYYAGKHGE